FRRMDGADRDQLRDALKVRPVASDMRTQRNDITALRLWRLRSRGDEGGTAAGLEHLERALRDIAADRVEHRIAVAHGLGEIHRVVVDDLVGTDLAQIDRKSVV